MQSQLGLDLISRSGLAVPVRGKSLTCRKVESQSRSLTVERRVKTPEIGRGGRPVREITRTRSAKPDRHGKKKKPT